MYSGIVMIPVSLADCKSHEIGCPPVCLMLRAIPLETPLGRDQQYGSWVQSLAVTPS
jgi:hypothetical protein